jgi:glycine cleavage system regulatory protein
MRIAEVSSSRNAWQGGSAATPESNTGSTDEDDIKPPAKYHREFFTVALENPNAGRLITTLTCKVANNMLLVTVDGEERRGVLAFVTKAFTDFGVNIESCNGRRMKFTQGCYFELTHSPENEEKVRAMFEHLERHASGQFSPKALVPFDRVYDLKVDVLHDRVGLLYPMAALLASHNVNLRYFRAHKEDLGGLHADLLAEVEVTAGLELPVGLNLEWLQEELRKVCPPGSRFTYTKRWPRNDAVRIVRN